MTTMNRLHNSGNRFQGDFKKVLCICSAGLLRSPTIAWVLSQPPWNYNTRAAGITEEYALIYADEVLVYWADEIVCAEHKHLEILKRKYDLSGKNLMALGIPDNFPYRDEELAELIKTAYTYGSYEK